MDKLFIICGHGAGDPGACKNGFQEAERVRALAERIKYFGGDSVIIGDTSKNWYKDNLISKGIIPKGSKVLELHMNSFTTSTPKGGMLYIKEGLKADKYDEALAKLMKEILPGRITLIQGRSDLANPKRAYNCGYNYRLLECGFISNAGDVQIFNSRMDDIAKGILKCFDITPKEPASEKWYKVQVGAFKVKANAEKMKKELESKGYKPFIVEG